jgi:hypothetical protein
MLKTNHWYHWIFALIFWSFAVVFYQKDDLNIMGQGSTPIVWVFAVWGLFRAVNGYLLFKRKNRS